MPEQRCPLCKDLAKFKQAPYGTSNKCFSCPKCLNFVITPEAEKLLTEAPEDWKAELSETSKNVVLGKILLIFVEVEADQRTIKFRSDEEGKWF